MGDLKVDVLEIVDARALEQLWIPWTSIKDPGRRLPTTRISASFEDVRALVASGWLPNLSIIRHGIFPRRSQEIVSQWTWRSLTGGVATVLSKLERRFGEGQRQIRLEQFQDMWAQILRISSRCGFRAPHRHQHDKPRLTHRR